MATTRDDVRREGKQATRRANVGRAVDSGLDSALYRLGYDLQGISIKLSGADCLMVIKALDDGVPKVCFVGAETMASAFLKATREADSATLRWKDDKWANS